MGSKVITCNNYMCMEVPGDEATCYNYAFRGSMWTRHMTLVVLKMCTGIPGRMALYIHIHVMYMYMYMYIVCICMQCVHCTWVCYHLLLCTMYVYNVHVHVCMYIHA